MSTTYDTDMVEPLAIGNWTLNAAVSDERKVSSSSDRTRRTSARAQAQRERRGAQSDDRDDVPPRAAREIAEHSPKIV